MTCDDCSCKTPAIGIYKFEPWRPDVPKYGTSAAACFDLAFEPREGETQIKVVNLYGLKDYAYIENGEIDTFPGNIYMFPTNIFMDIPHGYSVRIYPRSSTPLKYGLTLANNTGIIDSDYVDEIFLMMTPIFPSKIKVGTRLCQAELVKVTQADMYRLINQPSPKGNRTGGFGSTGD